MKIDNKQWKWTREPKDFTISEDKIEVITNPHTDLWRVLTTILEMIMHLFFR